jgi:hypothetical protein
MTRRKPPEAKPPLASQSDAQSALHKNWWTWAIAAIAAIGAVATGLATFTDSLSTLWAKRDVLIHLLDNETSFKLRDVKKVYHRASVAAGHTDDNEVMVEAVSSRRSITKCEADLDTHSGKDYYRSADKSGNVNQQDSSDYGLIRFNFYIPKKDFPTKGDLRLRCNGAISEWTNVSWPIDEKTEDYRICVGEKPERCAGVIHLNCGTNVEAWARTTHPEVCKNVKQTTLHVIDGNRCGYTNLLVTCSTVPIP